jgi:hypothetical protein
MMIVMGFCSSDSHFRCGAKKRSLGFGKAIELRRSTQHDIQAGRGLLVALEPGNQIQFLPRMTLEERLCLFNCCLSADSLVIPRVDNKGPCLVVKLEFSDSLFIRLLTIALCAQSMKAGQFPEKTPANIKAKASVALKERFLNRSQH